MDPGCYLRELHQMMKAIHISQSLYSSSYSSLVIIHHYFVIASYL